MASEDAGVVGRLLFGELDVAFGIEDEVSAGVGGGNLVGEVLSGLE